MEAENNTNQDFFTGLCGEPLLNTSAAWDASTPYLGRCLERTVLTWIPCLFLFIFAPVTLVTLHRSSTSSASSSLSSLRSHQAPLPWSPLLLCKMIISVVVMTSSLAEMVVFVAAALLSGGDGGDGLTHPAPTAPHPPPLPMDLVAPLVLVVAYGLAVVVVAAGRRYGQRSSDLLFIFWTLMVLCGVPQLASTIIALLHSTVQHQEDGEPPPPHHHPQHHHHQHHPALITTFLLQYIGGVVLMVLHCIAEPADHPDGVVKVKESPEDVASFLSRHTYQWVTNVLMRGRRRPLTPEDLWPLPRSCRIPAVDAKWRGAWRREMSCVRRKALARTTTTNNAFTSNTSNSITMSSNNISNNSRTFHNITCGSGGGSIGGSVANGLNSGGGCGSSGSGGVGTLHVSVVKVALRAYLWHYLFNLVLRLVSEMTLFITPVLLGRLITTSADSEPTWHSYVYATLLMVTGALVSLVRQCFFYEASKIVLRCRAALMMAVYRKTLTISPGARRESTAGEIVNLMSVDAHRVSEFSLHLSVAFVIPCIIIVAAWQLWGILGPSVLAGMIVMVIMIPIDAVVAGRIKSLQSTQMQLKDKRIKLAGEIINGIKVLKLNAWEEPFGKQVEQVRKEEIQVLTKASYYQSFVIIVWFITPILVSLASFATFILVSDDNKLDAETAFVSIALFNLLRQPVSEIPTLILQGVQAKVSLARLEKFFAAQNLDPKAVCSDASKERAIKVEGGAFHWGGGGEWSLQGVEVEVRRGELVAVVGPVGAGKSSLLSAFLGQMEKTEGEVVVNGQVALVSQEVWLQNASLRENITWGSPWEEARYWRVVEACALLPDLDMLPARDLTEVGEKGINLSGGQKQRVGLARAAYSCADVMLLDDPLSAVDANVGRHIFECLLGPSGLMAGTTRVLVTHALWVLPKADRVVVIEEGQLVEQGTCGELVEKGGSLARLLVHHIARKEEVKEEKEEEEVVEEAAEMMDGEMESEGLEELCAHLEHLPGGQHLLRQISRHSSTSGQVDMASQNSITRHSHHPTTTPTTSPGHNRQTSSTSSTFSSASTPAGNGRRNSTTISTKRHITTTKPGYKMQTSTTSSTSMGVAEDEGGMEMVEKGQKGGQLVEEEAIQTGRVGWKVYRFYVISTGLVSLLIALVSFFVAQGLQAGSSYWLAYWSSAQSSNTINNITTTTNTTMEGEEKEKTEEIEFDRVQFLIGYAGFGIGQAFFIYLSSMLVRWRCLKAAKDIHNRLLDALLHLPTSFFDTNPSGRIMTRLGKEINVLDNVLPMVLSLGIAAFSQVVVTLVVVVESTPLMGVVVLLVMGAYFVVLTIYITAHRQIKRIESFMSSPVYSFFGETVQGVTTIRAFRRQESFIEGCQSRVEGAMQGFLALIASNRWLAVRMELVGNLIVFGTSLFAVLVPDTISPGKVGLSITYALNVTVILNFFVRMCSEMEAHIVSVERIKEYIEEEKEAPWRVTDAPPEAWPHSGAMTIRGLRVRYRPGLDFVLRGLTCSVRAGEKVGIAGRTGAGKSSLTLALFRIIEAEGGVVEVDGRDIAKVGLHDLRSRITIIPQDPVLFSGTLRFNLDPTGNLGDAEVWHALELAHLASFVKSQPLGLTMTIDEGGANLSVGQRQLVGLARALLRRSPLLVLDEATAAVDANTDHLIQATIRQEFAQCTVLTIAHRLHTILDSDRVMVLEQGRIAEYDSPSVLLARRDSIFRSLARDAGLVEAGEEDKD